MRVRVLFLAFLLPLAGGCAGEAEEVHVLGEAQDPRFKSGEVWTYVTRPNETGSRVIILKVDGDSATGNIVHVRLEGLSIKPRKDVGVSLTEIEFIPITEEALGDSVLSKEGTRESLPNFDGAYDSWRHGVESGRGVGTFNVTLNEVLGKYEEILDLQAQLSEAGTTN